MRTMEGLNSVALAFKKRGEASGEEVVPIGIGSDGAGVGEEVGDPVAVA